MSHLSTSTVRFMRATSNRVQSHHIAPTFTSNISLRPASSCSRPLTTRFFTPGTPTKRATLQTSPLQFLQTSFTRKASSTASQTTSSPDITWNRFLALRKIRRRISLGSSIVCAGIVVVGGIGVMTSNDWEGVLASSLGLDPIAVLGLSFAGFGCVGWLLGPFFGNTVFALMYRGIRPAIEAKERAFYNRIKTHRVDPANSSLNNPVPDYYGEKIGSVGDYRRWLKDQRAFNLKRKGLRN